MSRFAGALGGYVAGCSACIPVGGTRWGIVLVTGFGALVRSLPRCGVVIDRSFARGDYVEFRVSGVWWRGRIAALEGDSAVIVTRKPVGQGHWVTVPLSDVRSAEDGGS